MKMRWIAAAALLMVFPIVLAVTAEDAAPAYELLRYERRR